MIGPKHWNKVYPNKLVDWLTGAKYSHIPTNDPGVGPYPSPDAELEVRMKELERKVNRLMLAAGMASVIDDRVVDRD